MSPQGARGNAEGGVQSFHVNKEPGRLSSPICPQGYISQALKEIGKCHLCGPRVDSLCGSLFHTSSTKSWVAEVRDKLLAGLRVGIRSQFTKICWPQCPHQEHFFCVCLERNLNPPQWGSPKPCSWENAQLSVLGRNFFRILTIATLQRFLAPLSL
jgi:hypothetical protein